MTLKELQGKKSAAALQVQSVAGRHNWTVGDDVVIYSETLRGWRVAVVRAVEGGDVEVHYDGRVKWVDGRDNRTIQPGRPRRPASPNLRVEPLAPDASLRIGGATPVKYDTPIISAPPIDAGGSVATAAASAARPGDEVAAYSKSLGSWVAATVQAAEGGQLQVAYQGRVKWVDAAETTEVRLMLEPDLPVEPMLEPMLEPELRLEPEPRLPGRTSSWEELQEAEPEPEPEPEPDKELELLDSDPDARFRSRPTTPTSPEQRRAPVRVGGGGLWAEDVGRAPAKAQEERTDKSALVLACAKKAALC